MNITFVSVNKSNDNHVKSTKRDLYGDVVMVWQLIHALQVNSRLLSDVQKIFPPTDDIKEFSTL